MFDLSMSKLLILAVIALIVFGPNELPKIAAQAGRALRDLRRIAEAAKSDIQDGLGPEFRDFDFEDLSPRRFVQKHLLDEPAVTPEAAARLNGPGTGGQAAATAAVDTGVAANGTRPVLQDGDDPPFDLEAT